MNSSVQPPPEVICVRCGHRNAGDASRCGNCGVPLDDFAATAPWEMGSAEGPAYNEPVAPRTKPIVFWGVWLYFGPTAVGAGILAYNSLGYPLDGSPEEKDVAGTVAILVMCGLYGATSCWALWSVTAGYLKRR